MFIQTVALKDLKFYAFHGYYPEEQLIGNHFSVDVEVTFIPMGNTEEIDSTVNYEVINALVIKEMGEVKSLLETVVKNIVDALLLKYPELLTVTVGIKKNSPMMIGQVGHSFVQLAYTAAPKLE